MINNKQEKHFRSEALRLAIEDGYFKDATESRKYTLEVDGTWRLKANQNQWFKVNTKLY